MEQIVLLVDNDPKFLEGRAEILASEGYRVLTADDLATARDLLANRRIHLGVFDVRMVDDDDENDISGWLLADQPEYADLPKIILTAWPKLEMAVEALRQSARRRPTAIDYVKKGEGPEPLLEAVARGFKEHVAINWDLAIEWQEQRDFSFLHLANLIEPGLDRSLVLERAGELEDLVRKLFAQSDQLTINRIVWHGQGRACLTVQEYRTKDAWHPCVVTLGLRQRMAAEVAAYQQYVGGKSQGTIQLGSVGMLHHIAVAYAMSGADLGIKRTFAQFYKENRSQALNRSVSQLYEQTLSSWHDLKYSQRSKETLAEAYAGRFGLESIQADSERFHSEMRALAEEAYPLDTTRIQFEGDQLVLVFSSEKSARYTHSLPVSVFEQEPGARPVVCSTSPGILSGENILVGQEGRTWLTDFVDAGPTPEFADYGALEAIVRFDLVEPLGLEALHDFEQRLTKEPDTLVTALYTDYIDSQYVKALRVIQGIRSKAAESCGGDLDDYSVGLLFEALRRLRDYDSSVAHSKLQCYRYVHALLAAVMLVDAIGASRQSGADPASEAKLEIEIDETKYEVWINGRRKRLRPTDFAIFHYLYQNAGRACSRREIVEQGLGDVYTGKSDDARITMAIKRIRVDLASHADLIRTVRLKGYVFGLEDASS